MLCFIVLETVPSERLPVQSTKVFHANVPALTG
jgi:hypothetical protein